VSTEDLLGAGLFVVFALSLLVMHYCNVDE